MNRELVKQLQVGRTYEIEINGQFQDMPDEVVLTKIGTKYLYFEIIEHPGYENCKIKWCIATDNVWMEGEDYRFYDDFQRKYVVDRLMKGQCFMPANLVERIYNNPDDTLDSTIKVFARGYPY